jgi:hypothetical protein
MADLPSALVASLNRNGVSTSAALQRELGAGQATLSRAFAALGDRIVRIGAGRNTRYGLRREIPQIGSSWPLLLIDNAGTPRLLGRLHALAHDQYWLDSSLGQHPQLTDGIPFYLQDLIPQGFLGRLVPMRFPELSLPTRISDWNDDHVLTYLCQRGEDVVGNLILGEESLQRFLKKSAGEPPSINTSRRKDDYPQLARQAVAGTVHGSSAGGEHPKFTTSLAQGSGLRHVLVKFSPEGTGAPAQRWRDLVVCEHIATRVLQRAGLTSTSTDLLASGERTFVESVRFDRTGARGRIGLISLAALSNEFLGVRDTWPGLTSKLSKLGLVSQVDTEVVRRLWTFGRLIGNTDMHPGNLSFHFQLERPLPLAPVYDMLPMLYAPTAGDVVSAREFEMPLPSSESLDIWESMASLAESYWREVADHPQLSSGFAAIANENAGKLARARRGVMPVR